jgi:catechol 2,3-dioxygenase-like lactoylglutathione lyase family enzyme
MEKPDITGSNVTIMVKNMDRSIQFYENIGLKLDQRWGDHYAMVGAKGITLGIHPTKKTKRDSGTVSIGFMIKDVLEVKALLAKHKIKFREVTDKSGIYLHFRDPDGTIVYFIQPGWG